ncbi:DUF2510 domain-containing protein [Mycolicibacterium helvum]|uniref:DUF2510 domain-containing protein n=1 Tax=Mycolicibacterium helvum TaxID=1534349 RepID=A0A7I7TG87_9MYCO|nr:DUF2510 domain-containing protein [Mycolicibacterium helvum]BBY67359.1 hypothetical protein MHEL_56020 [Mycolicibacterium helvum]
MPSESDGAPPGWYPAPQGGQRYWDGERWLALPEPDDATPFPAEATGSAEKPATNKKKLVIVIACVATLIVLAGAGVAALVWKNNHDTQMRNDASAAASSKAAADKAAADQAQADQVRRDTEAKRAQRAAAVKDLEASITTLAQKHINGGLFDGPVLSVSCDPVGGGSTDDLTARTTIFECFAATRDNGDGTLSGHKYHATMNWDTGEYTYGLGDR